MYLYVFVIVFETVFISNWSANNILYIFPMYVCNNYFTGLNLLLLLTLLINIYSLAIYVPYTAFHINKCSVLAISLINFY